MNNEVKTYQPLGETALHRLYEQWNNPDHAEIDETSVGRLFATIHELREKLKHQDQKDFIIEQIAKLLGIDPNSPCFEFESAIKDLKKKGIEQSADVVKGLKELTEDWDDLTSQTYEVAEMTLRALLDHTVRVPPHVSVSRGHSPVVVGHQHDQPGTACLVCDEKKKEKKDGKAPSFALQDLPSQLGPQRTSDLPKVPAGSTQPESLVEIDLDGHIDEKGIRYIGKAVWQEKRNRWVCLAEVAGALCTVEVSITPKVQDSPHIKVTKVLGNR